MAREINIKDYTREELEKMAIEQLEEHMRDLYNARQALKAEQGEVHAILENKQIDLNIAMKLKNLSDKEREHLHQKISGSNIKAREGVHAGRKA